MADEKKILEQRTQTLFPGMMQSSRILIIDFDVTRFHSFDLLRYKLMDKSWFDRCNIELVKYLAEHNDITEQVLYYKGTCSSPNSLVNFRGIDPEMPVEEFEAILKEAMTNQTGLMHTTPTDMSRSLDAIFQRNDIKGYWLHYSADNHFVSFKDSVKEFTSDRILDGAMALHIIKQYNINCIVVSSIDMAIMLGTELYTHGYRRPITILFGKYRYNFDDHGTVNHLIRVNALEYSMKYEFGTFEPYTRLIQVIKEIKRNDEHSV